MTHFAALPACLALSAAQPGETHRADGQKILRRMTLFNLGQERVRQYSVRSPDGGRTWGAGYDLIYVRRK